MLHIIWSIIIGFIIGLIARAIMPGAQNLGFVVTTLIGVGGSILRGPYRSALFQARTGHAGSSCWNPHVDHRCSTPAFPLGPISPFKLGFLFRSQSSGISRSSGSHFDAKNGVIIRCGRKLGEELPCSAPPPGSVPDSQDQTVLRTFSLFPGFAGKRDYSEKLNL